MTTAAEIVADAAALILVDEANSSLEGSTVNLLTRILNDYLAELNSAGVDLGYRPVSSPSDLVTIPSGANLAIKYGLALRSNAVFGLPIPAEVSGLYPGLERSLRSSYMRLPKVKPQRTLPMGTGNHYNVYDLNTFYPPSKPEGQLRLPASTTVSFGASNVLQNVTGPWDSDRLVNLNSIDGNFEYVLDDSYLARLKADLTLSTTTGDRYTFYFTRNDAVIDQSNFEIVADRAQNINFQFVDTIYRQDNVRLVVENNTGTNDLTITHGHFTLD